MEVGKFLRSEKQILGRTVTTPSKKLGFGSERISLKASSCLIGRGNSFAVHGTHVVMGYLSEMFSAAGREKVDGESNVILGNRRRPSGEMGARL